MSNKAESGWGTPKAVIAALGTLGTVAVLIATVSSFEPLLGGLVFVVGFGLWCIIVLVAILASFLAKDAGYGVIYSAILVFSLPVVGLATPLGDALHLAWMASSYEMQIRAGHEPMFRWDTGDLFTSPASKVVIYEPSPGGRSLVLRRAQGRFAEVKQVRHLFGDWYLVLAAY